MHDHGELMKQLLSSPVYIIKETNRNATPRQQGIYILRLLDEGEPTVLKVGIAGPRKGKGLMARLRDHFSSGPNKTVLARHMAEDLVYGEKCGYNFSDRSQRQQFLASRCHFQIMALPDLTRDELEVFEAYVEEQLRPRYIGTIKREH